MSQLYGPHSVGYYTRHDASNEHFSDAPVSVDYARMIRHNALHMFDESTQVVSNMLAPASAHQIDVGSGGWQLVTSIPVPLVLRLDGAPATLVYRVAVGDSDLDVAMNVVNMSAPFVRQQPDAHISVSGSNTFGSGTVWAISGSASFELDQDSTRRARATLSESEMEHATYTDTSKTQPSTVVTNWWRADIWMDDNEDSRLLAGVYLRQFMLIASGA